MAFHSAAALENLFFSERIIHNAVPTLYTSVALNCCDFTLILHLFFSNTVTTFFTSIFATFELFPTKEISV